MKKNFHRLIIMVLSILLLSGCNNSNKEAQQGNKKTDIEVWLTPQWKGVMDPSEPDADYDSFFKEAAKRYEKKHPNVNISVQIIPGEQRADKLSVAIQTKTLPDIFFDSSFALSEYAHMGVLAPLDDIIDKQTKDDIPTSIWDNVQINNVTYFYPFGHNPGTLAYNADMFKKAGLDKYISGEKEIANWTIDDFKIIVNQLKKSNPSIAPFGLFAKNNQGDTWNLAYMRMFGNQFFDENGQIIVNQKNGVEALSFLNDLNNQHLTTTGPESLSSNDVNAMFQNQQTAINFTNSVLFSGIQRDMKDGKIDKFDMRLANIPGKDTPISFTYVTSSVVFDTGNKEKMDIAKDFVKFYSTDSELIQASKNTLPVRESVSKKLKADLPYLEAYNKNAKYIINFSNNTPGYAQLRNIFYPELQAVFTNEKTPKEALDNFTKQGNRIIKNNQRKSLILN